MTTNMSDNSEVTTKRVSERVRVAEAVSRCVTEKTHGDTITKAELLAWFSLAYPQVGTKRDFSIVDMAFVSMKSKFDTSLLTRHKMALEAERGEVWRIVLPSEQAELATRTARTAFSRGLAKAQAVASNVDVAGLNDTQRARLDDTSARLAAIQLFAAKKIPRGLPDGGEG